MTSQAAGTGNETIELAAEMLDQFAGLRHRTTVVVSTSYGVVVRHPPTHGESNRSAIDCLFVLLRQTRPLRETTQQALRCVCPALLCVRMRACVCVVSTLAAVQLISVVRWMTGRPSRD